jgi:hypothetical protein
MKSSYMKNKTGAREGVRVLLHLASFPQSVDQLTRQNTVAYIRKTLCS